MSTPTTFQRKGDFVVHVAAAPDPPGFALAGTDSGRCGDVRSHLRHHRDVRRQRNQALQADR
jgi:hypothetical protein